MGWRRSADQITAIRPGEMYLLAGGDLRCRRHARRGATDRDRREGWIEVDLGKCNVMARSWRVLEINGSGQRKYKQKMRRRMILSFLSHSNTTATGKRKKESRVKIPTEGE